MSREIRASTPVRPMDGVLSDMRALVTTTRRLVVAAAGEVTRQARVSAPAIGLGGSSGDAPETRYDDEFRERMPGWETQDDLAFERDESEDTDDTEDAEEVAGSGPLRGIWIAAATFVPTFLTIVLGATYLAGLPVGVQSSTGSKNAPLPVVSGPVEAQRQPGTPTLTTVANAAAPPRVPSPPTREVPDQAAAPAIAWVRGAAFPDRDSAERLAARIEQQGYASRVRREGSGADWVVWIAKHPKGRAPSGRRE